MAHNRLVPKPEHAYLDNLEVLRRLRMEFAYVDDDSVEGQRTVDRMITQLKRMRSLTPPPATDVDIAILERHRNEAISVTISDELDHGYTHLTFTIIPGKPIFVGYLSQQHQEVSHSLLQRCAASLSYEIDE